MPKKTGELIEFLFHSLPESNMTPEKRPRSAMTIMGMIVSLKETSRGYLQSFHFCFELDRILTYGFFLDSSPKVLDSSNREFFALCYGSICSNAHGRQTPSVFLDK